MNECDMDIRFCRQLQCQNTVGTYTCGCHQGFERVLTADRRQYTCADIDECSNRNTCPENAVCRNREGGYKCICNSGFEGETCSDIDECSNNKTMCDINADCSNSPGGFKCSCKTGFIGTGQQCEKGQCQDSIRADNKRCSSLTMIDCVCRDGFVDGVNDTCSDIDECSLIQDCDLNAECINLPGSYVCECADDFYGNGTTCFEGDCIDSDCPANEQCITPRRSDCECKDGFYRDKSENCVDVDECEKTNDCHQNATCSNIEGTYNCNCKSGFYGTGKSCFRGDCTDTNCPGNQTCIEPTSTSCGCSEGLANLGTSCYDIDECLLGIHKCQNNLECLNQSGNYTCEHFCEEGFVRSSSADCLDIDECASSIHNCSSDQQCVNTDGTFSCKERLLPERLFNRSLINRPFLSVPD